ncbi:hypothetical protein [Methanocaldococcus fervens]|uniref:HEPN domain-containing protein n=1 Tax=Methanocaldococcus fervens (strain DSM 4213 / JCM 15782 / AG86) TaxID=573064 RepID=C7P8T9_METFA|nr:hypothetical protein [Methanocaldococcus fervens]ACV24971.1 hypothetical protein Mefer_1162 [Methanocaldococcus fervens AG86]
MFHQNFDIKEFYGIANFLHNNFSSNELINGAYRTAIGRYYYYAYLTLRGIILDNDNRDNVINALKSASSHYLVRDYIFCVGEYLNNKDIKHLAKTLETLHNLRKKADYKPHENVELQDVNRSKYLVNFIDHLIKEVSWGDRRGLSNILNKLKGEGKLPKLVKNKYNTGKNGNLHIDHITLKNFKHLLNLY